MKQDEIDLMLDKSIPIHPKRFRYLKRKWEKKGWVGEEFNNIKNLVGRFDSDAYKVANDLDGRVVLVAFKGWLPWTVGILEDHGDNGWHLFTKKTIKNNYSYYIGDYSFKEVAFIRPYPSQKVWNKLNYLFWLYHKRSDRFHQKINQMSPTTTCDYHVIDGKYSFTYKNPHGNMGECFPWCQCKKIGENNG